MNKFSTENQAGIGCFGILIVIALVLVGLTFIADKAFIYYELNCTEETLTECLLNRNAQDEPLQGSVTATGPYSVSGHSVVVTMHIPLDGGKVTGTVAGDCTGKVTGSYDGQNNGVISGNINGACSIFIVDVPAKASFNGTVNKDAKSVPISFTGSGGGFTKSDSMVLSY